MIHLQIRPYYRKFDFLSILKSAAEAVLLAEAKNGDLSIVLTGDKEIRELNRSYRNLDSATDVLSFPSGELDPDSGELYLGDIVLSYQRAAHQATTEGHSIQDELSLLVVHGVLHLLGYDHSEPDDRNKMWMRQEKILSALAINMSNFSSLEI